MPYSEIPTLEVPYYDFNGMPKITIKKIVFSLVIAFLLCGCSKNLYPPKVKPNIYLKSHL